MKQIQRLMFYILLSVLGVTPALVIADEQEVYSFEPGVHVVDRIEMSKPNSLLRGAGRGVTLVYVKEGVVANAPNPVIRDITIIGAGYGVGITLRNTWSASVENVEIENYLTGIDLVLDDEGHELAGGHTEAMWPSTSKRSGHWGSRVSLTEIKYVEITDGRYGIVLRNMLEKGNRGTRGQFFTATNIWGGHIYVSDTAVSVGDHVWNTKLFGTYIDVMTTDGKKNHAIVMEPKARRMTLVGVHVDLSSKKMKKSGAFPLVVKSRKARDEVNVTVSSFDKSDIRYIEEKNPR